MQSENGMSEFISAIRNKELYSNRYFQPRTISINYQGPKFYGVADDFELCATQLAQNNPIDLLEDEIELDTNIKTNLYKLILDDLKEYEEKVIYDFNQC